MADLNIMNLYPPQMPTYQDAFLATETCRIYFSLSIYNSFNEINKNAQVTVSNQQTNKSVLLGTKYPNEIKLCEVKRDAARASDQYYIEIFPADLENGFEINQYYKVQIRFTSSTAPEPPSDAGIDKWLVDNKELFSEWSTICLIRAISQPSLQLVNFPDEGDVIFSNSNVDIVGSLVFEDENESDQLSNYQIKLYNNEDTSNPELVLDSGIIYTNSSQNSNQLNYTLDYLLEPGTAYLLTISIETRNYYFQTFDYTLLIVQATDNPLNANIIAENDAEMGSIKVSIAATEFQNFTGSVIIRRTSSKSNFNIWEDVYERVYNVEDNINFVWYDITVQSGVWYKYAAQKKLGAGSRGAVTEMEEPVLAYFEDMFLIANNQQVRIRYNQQVSSMRQNIAEARTETLGAQYPYIRRNGYINYRSLSISGLITFFNDYNDTFTSKDELYGDAASPLYAAYNETQNITDFNDYVHEREFREKIIQFLYADNIKLFKTLTEGNVLVKLMNVSLSPQQSLGRYLYSFSCEAYEIAADTFDNYLYYNIIEKEQMNSEADADLVPDTTDIQTVEVLGQIYDTVNANENIVDAIAARYESQTSMSRTEFDKLTSIKLQFADEPYYIKETSSGLAPLAASDPLSSSIGLGYIVYINNIPIMVNQNGLYQINDLGDGEITSISFPIDSNIELDYTALLTITNLIGEEEGITSQLYTYKDIVGQLWSAFDYEENAYEIIEQKYTYQIFNASQRLILVGGVQVEANSGTVIYIQTSAESKPVCHVINDTNLLTIIDDNLRISNIYFGGIHLEETLDDREELVGANKFFTEIGKVYNSTSEITYPEANHVYQIVDNKRFIWYNNNWYEMDNNNNVQTTVEAILNYYCRVLKEEYQSEQ